MLPQTGIGRTRVVPGLLLVLLLLVLTPATALAHAEYQSSSPKPDQTVTAPLAQVTIDFSDDLRPNSHFEVLDGTGAVVAKGLPDATTKNRMVADTSSLGPGNYSVKWTSVATDKDVAHGVFGFTIAAATPAPPTPSPTSEASGTASPSTSASPTQSPTAPASVSAAASASPGPTPTSGQGSDVAIPIIATLLVVGGIGLFLARRQRRT